MYSGAENKSYFNENDGTKDCTPNNQFNQLWHCAQVKKIRKRIENKEGSGRLIIGIASFILMVIRSRVVVALTICYGN